MVCFKVFTVLLLVSVIIQVLATERILHRTQRQTSSRLFQGLRNSFSNLMSRFQIRNRNSHEMDEPVLSLTPPKINVQSRNQYQPRGPPPPVYKSPTTPRTNFAIFHDDTQVHSDQGNHFHHPQHLDYNEENYFPNEETRSSDDDSSFHFISDNSENFLDSSSGWRPKLHFESAPEVVNTLFQEDEALDIKDGNNIQISLFDHPNNFDEGFKNLPDEKDAVYYVEKERITSEPFVSEEIVFDPFHQRNRHPHFPEEDLNRPFGNQLQDIKVTNQYLDEKPKGAKPNFKRESEPQNFIEDDSHFKSETSPKKRNIGYEFGYGVRDKDTGNRFYHMEMKKDGLIEGSYKVQLPDGRVQSVEYVADDNGFHPHISFEGDAKYPPSFKDAKDTTAR